MIRVSTLICAAAAAGAGLYLYHVKYQTRLLDRGIAQTTRSIEATHDRAGVLRAEWTLMNDPERLAELAGQFLQLNTVAPKQFTTLADLSARLPAPRALPPMPEATTDEPINDTVEPVAEAPLPLPPPIPPRAVAAPAAPTPPAAPPVTQTAATQRPQSTTATAPRPAAPVTAQIPPRIQPGSVPPLAAPHIAAQPMPLTPVVTSSALGMARGIVAPPMPVGGPNRGNYGGNNSDIQLTRGN